MLLFHKEKQGDKRIIHLLGLKISYKKKGKNNYYKSLYEQTLEQLNYLKKHSDITKLKPATGELRELQLRTLGLASEVANLINKNNLEYFLIGGNLLGAVRHKGFIPWDDDFDFGMMRKDYEEFSKYCAENMVCLDSSKLHIADIEKYTRARYKLYDEYLRKNPKKYIYFRNNEHIIILKGTSFLNCVSVDIFPLDYIDEKMTKEQYVAQYDIIREKQIKIDSLNKVLLFLKETIKNSPIIKQKSEKIAGSFDSSALVGRTYFFQAKDVFPLKKAKYENCEFFIPNNYNVVLEGQYGNFMEFPSDLGLSHHLDCRNEFFEQPIIQDKNSQVEFYLIDSFEIYHYLPIYNELLKQGINAKIVAEPCEINTSGKWFDYNEAIRILEENNIDYCTKANPNAKIAITTQRADLLSKYRNKKACLSYGVGLNKDNFAIDKNTVEGFDIRFVHGQYQKDKQIKYMNEKDIHIIGWPKHEKYFAMPHNKAEILDKLEINTDKKILVYFPTWDEDSSIQKFANKIKDLRKDFYVVAKAHHCTFRLNEKKDDLYKLYEISDKVLDGNSSLEEAALIGDYALIDAKSGASTEIPYLNKKLKILLLSPRENLELYYNETVLSKIKIINNYADFDNEINKLQHESKNLIDTDYFCGGFIEEPSRNVVAILKSYMLEVRDGSYKR